VVGHLVGAAAERVRRRRAAVAAEHADVQHVVDDRRGAPDVGSQPPRPDRPARLDVDRVQVAAPVAEVGDAAGDGRRRGQVVHGGVLPVDRARLRFEAVHRVVAADEDRPAVAGDADRRRAFPNAAADDVPDLLAGVGVPGVDLAVVGGAVDDPVEVRRRRLDDVACRCRPALFAVLDVDGVHQVVERPKVRHAVGDDRRVQRPVGGGRVVPGTVERHRTLDVGVPAGVRPVEPPHRPVRLRHVLWPRLPKAPGRSGAREPKQYARTRCPQYPTPRQPCP